MVSMVWGVVVHINQIGEQTIATATGTTLTHQLVHGVQEKRIRIQMDDAMVVSEGVGVELDEFVRPAASACEE